MKRKFIFLYIIICLLITIPIVGPAQSKTAPDKQEKLANIGRMIKIEGTAENIMASLPKIVDLVKMSKPEVPDELWKEFLAEFTEDYFIDLLVPIYDKYLTNQEVMDIIAFNESPSGRKLLDISPKIEQQILEASQGSLKLISQKILKKFEEESINEMRPRIPDQQALYQKLSEKYGQKSVNMIFDDEGQRITVVLINTSFNKLKQEKKLEENAQGVAKFVRYNYPTELISISVVRSRSNSLTLAH